MYDLRQADSPANIAEASLYRVARDEAERHKWIESEKAGRDLGEAALYDWSQRYWWSWSRQRWIEHLCGDRRWSELDAEGFGLLRRSFHHNHELLGLIVDRIRRGGENLDIIRWVISEGHCVDDAIEILSYIDINSARRSFFVT